MQAGVGVRTGKDAVVISDALTLWRATALHVEEAYPADTFGPHEHGTIQIGDTFTRGEMMKFTGIRNFAPELVPSYSPERSARAQEAAATERAGAA